jgi:hypothetical protein
VHTEDSFRRPGYPSVGRGPWALRPRLTAGLPLSWTSVPTLCVQHGDKYLGHQKRAIRKWPYRYYSHRERVKDTV